ncbi:MAG: nucleotide exchange factor GrpE [Puniceicoccales bacterium]|jgi:molecular chaperone GrpE|nr:nucleotide exchange factor GrpE [Puniceicoccales bacterium]
MRNEQEDSTDYAGRDPEMKVNDVEMNETNPMESVDNDYRSDVENKMLLLQADFDNFRKRVARDRDDYQKFACASLMAELLPVLDVFEIGFKSVDQSNPMVSGFAMAFNQLKAVLTNNGLTEVLPIKENFDPALHEAVAYISSDEVPIDGIIEVARIGYMLNGKLLRPASVVVSSGKLEQMEQK